MVSLQQDAAEKVFASAEPPSGHTQGRERDAGDLSGHCPGGGRWAHVPEQGRAPIQHSAPSRIYQGTVPPPPPQQAGQVRSLGQGRRSQPASWSQRHSTQLQAAGLFLSCSPLSHAAQFMGFQGSPLVADKDGTNRLAKLAIPVQTRASEDWDPRLPLPEFISAKASYIVKAPGQEL